MMMPRNIRLIGLVVALLGVASLCYLQSHQIVEAWHTWIAGPHPWTYSGHLVQDLYHGVKISCLIVVIVTAILWFVRQEMINVILSMILTFLCSAIIQSQDGNGSWNFVTPILALGSIVIGNCVLATIFFLRLSSYKRSTAIAGLIYYVFLAVFLHYTFTN